MQSSLPVSRTEQSETNQAIEVQQSETRSSIHTTLPMRGWSFKWCVMKTQESSQANTRGGCRASLSLPILDY